MEITPQHLAEQLKSGGGVQLIDVRESAEVAEGMIPGAAHIALGELGSRLNELDKSRTVIAICRSGRRSAAAADQLTAAGFTAYTVPGGMLDWTAAGFPTV
ncbi:MULTISPECIES: rhodanese-like domain-containing protein [unclassified Arthrobacter]|uniref:rhodanese-like domain-containing protein n=1 Tax=unclassified Arthrobacter TaxID=235627 RepID=UPI002DFB5B48|nr:MULTISPECIES: rhodanese-like domain-containing protein [unclassified Arthrobacter]MEC5193429.1 rhodanese-related sulfurtransferase [Arthrobacter sp. MP_M4]MEC5204905.1 rhodanese-related sulfurtransferase [Arthrobacter sp. MP_M7]